MRRTTILAATLCTALLLDTSSVALADEAAVSRPFPPAVTDADYHDGGQPNEARVRLGQALFFDKALSGNRNIACATCHHPSLATADGLSLPLGEGPDGLGPERKTKSDLTGAVHGRVPRNSPALFNLGAREFTTMFHDGRVEQDPQGYYEGGFVTPAKWKLPKGLDNVLAAQAMFPVGSDGEMAGQKGENAIADAVSLNKLAGEDGVWDHIATRLQEIPEYVDLFEEAFPEEVASADDISFVLAANAIAAFETHAFRSDQSPFDDYLRGNERALTSAQLRGMDLFYGKADCASCHSGKFQTDHQFYAIAMPQIGPGKSDGRDASYWRETGHSAFVEDFGRGRVTVRPEDEFKFRTPSLRNVALTGPWGHSGCYDTLEDVIRHHVDPVAALESYELPDGLLPELGPILELTASGSSLSHQPLSSTRRDGFLKRDDWVARTPELRNRIARANELDPVELSDAEVDDLVAFLESLTDPTVQDLVRWVPERVPSGLPVED